MSATFCITRGDESAQRAPSDAKIGTSDTTPSPRVPQKALFKGREGQKGTDFQPKNSLPQPRTFHVVLTNMIGCFFILVKGFCNRFFFYLIPYGSLKICNQRLKTTFQHQVVLFQHQVVLFQHQVVLFQHQVVLFQPQVAVLSFSTVFELQVTFK